MPQSEYKKYGDNKYVDCLHILNNKSEEFN